MVVAIGENVPDLQTEDDKQASRGPMQPCSPRSNRTEAGHYCRSCFWPNEAKDDIMRRVAGEHRAAFVDTCGDGRRKSQRRIQGGNSAIRSLERPRGSWHVAMRTRSGRRCYGACRGRARRRPLPQPIAKFRPRALSACRTQQHAGRGPTRHVLTVASHGCHPGPRCLGRAFCSQESRACCPNRRRS